MKKKIILFATAIATLASCSTDEFIGDKTLVEANNNAPISFNFDVPMPTRASGAEAAAALDNQFIVYGEKNETAKTAPSAGNLVFPNYQVNYSANTAYTNTSNTENWDYVGSKHSSEYAANIKLGGTAVTTNDQTIKYWDYAATKYVFTAVSALPADITAGRVVIDKITTGSSTVYDKGYTITLAKKNDVYPDLSKLYFSDRQVIAQGTGKDRTADNAYGGNVTFTFRNSLSQVRAGVYETNPGYDVTNIKFYVTDNAEAKVSSTSAFGVIAPNINASSYEGTLTVSYNDNSVAAIENQPKLSFSGTKATDLILGTNMSTLSSSKLMGKAATTPTWDTDGGAYTSVLPQIDNTTNMTLKVDYTLYNDVTKEVMTITGKTVVVPAGYLAWKPNFKYTYLFKITDSDLYPITFDAVEIVAADGNAEYISVVSQPSITTFGYDATNNKYISGQNEYTRGCDIYAVILDGSTVIDPTLGTNVKVYSVATTNSTTYPITEGSVAESIAHPSSNQITASDVTNDGTTNFTAAPAKVTTVPSEDGNTVTINAVKLTGVKTGTYAIEYIKDSSTKVYKVIVVQ